MTSPIHKRSHPWNKHGNKLMYLFNVCCGEEKMVIIVFYKLDLHILLKYILNNFVIFSKLFIKNSGEEWYFFHPRSIRAVTLNLYCSYTHPLNNSKGER